MALTLDECDNRDDLIAWLESEYEDYCESISFAMRGYWGDGVTDEMRRGLREKAESFVDQCVRIGARDAGIY